MSFSVITVFPSNFTLIFGWSTFSTGFFLLDVAICNLLIHCSVEDFSTTLLSKVTTEFTINSSRKCKLSY